MKWPEYHVNLFRQALAFQSFSQLAWLCSSTSVTAKLIEESWGDSVVAEVTIGLTCLQQGFRQVSLSNSHVGNLLRSLSPCHHSQTFTNPSRT